MWSEAARGPGPAPGHGPLLPDGKLRAVTQHPARCAWYTWHVWLLWSRVITACLGAVLMWRADSFRGFDREMSIGNPKAIYPLHNATQFTPTRLVQKVFFIKFNILFLNKKIKNVQVLSEITPYR